MDNSNPIIDVKVQFVKLYGEYRYYCGDSDEYAGHVFCKGNVCLCMSGCIYRLCNHRVLLEQIVV